VSKVNKASLKGGDNVLFQGGATFSGVLSGNAGGEAGKPITYYTLPTVLGTRSSRAKKSGLPATTSSSSTT
jgi:hypothetical protein